MAERRSQGERAVRISAGGPALEGTLRAPPGALGAVVFIHGSGSSRFSPRNRQVARALGERSLATFLFDLMTPEEETLDRPWIRFDVRFLAGRAEAAVGSIARMPELAGLPIGLFGSSTGAAAALAVAALHPGAVAAVVSRGGRVDLAEPWLGRVLAPTLCIVGSRDVEVLELNRKAFPALAAARRSLEVVPGATHLFDEPGALERVSELAGNWFQRAFAEQAGLPASP